eukprot:757076-Hanusia_phi.AAC.2
MQDVSHREQEVLKRTGKVCRGRRAPGPEDGKPGEAQGGAGLRRTGMLVGCCGRESRANDVAGRASLGKTECSCGSVARPAGLQLRGGCRWRAEATWRWRTGRAGRAVRGRTLEEKVFLSLGGGGRGGGWDMDKEREEEEEHEAFLPLAGSE